MRRGNRARGSATADRAAMNSRGSLNQMLAPIARYPDELLGEILMAATYPLDVVEAARWLQDPRNASLKGDQLIAALQQQNWDPSVKLLAPFPSILRMMDAKLEVVRTPRRSLPRRSKGGDGRGPAAPPTGATRRQACFRPARNRANAARGEITIQALDSRNPSTCRFATLRASLRKRVRVGELAGSFRCFRVWLS